jgi:8-oxo-dGTP diphosphatase
LIPLKRVVRNIGMSDDRSVALSYAECRMNSPSTSHYCAHCGTPLGGNPPDGYARWTCPGCGRAPYDGPRALVLSLLFARDRFLVIKRGEPPYIGQWAPPGGYVEYGESLESAAVREVEEESGVVLRPEALIPYALVSLPQMNQFYAIYTARLPDTLPLRAKPPESLDARWVTATELASIEFWEPAAGFDMGRVYRNAQSDRFEFYQQTESFVRRFAKDRITYLRGPRDRNES